MLEVRRGTYLEHLHLDHTYALLTARAVLFLQTFYSYIDVTGQGCLDDVAFLAFMQNTTTLSDEDIQRIFSIFDTDGSGSIEFDEFYLLTAMMVAIKVGAVCGARLL